MLFFTPTKKCKYLVGRQMEIIDFELQYFCSEERKKNWWREGTKKDSFSLLN